MRRLALFARSVVLLGATAIGVPSALVFVARRRFGGEHPMYGVPRPTDWSADRVRGALTDRLTDQTIADIVIRLSLVVAWIAVAVLLVTVAAEVVHMARHDGLPAADVRGLGLPQRLARVIATGLLVATPLMATSSAAIARGGATLPMPEPPVATGALAAADAPSVVGSTSEHDGVAGHGDADRTDAHGASASSQYVVQAGDSVYGIAQRLVGPDPGTVAAYADRIIELNMGREMVDGRPFNNAAFIDVGWVLDLPTALAGQTDTASSIGSRARVHLVVPGESLWSIAGDELGDPERWPEIFEANQGRSFGGRVFDDPSLIQPGWELDVPRPAGDVDVSVASSGPATDAAPEGERATTEAVVEVIEMNERVDAPERQVGSTDSPVLGAVAEVSSRPDNVWVHDADASDRAAADGPAADGGDEAGVELLTLHRAAMLSAGALTLLAARRRNHLRRAQPRARLAPPRPGPAETELALRSADVSDRFERLVTALCSIGPTVADAKSRVLAVVGEREGDVEVRLTGDAQLAAPWVGHADVWRLPAAAPIELLRQTAVVELPCPTLVQLGIDPDGGEVYVDLEALEALEIGGPGSHADAVVAALAATLAGSTLAEVTTLVGVGVPDEAFLDHRLYRPARDTTTAFAEAADAIGSTASMNASTFELRVSGDRGDAWEPAVVLAGASVGTMTPPADRTGLAVVSASPIHGPSSRLAPDGDGWRLLPADIRLIPVGLSATDVAALAELVDVDAAAFATTADPPPGALLGVRAADRPDGMPLDEHDDSDRTIAPPLDSAEAASGDESGASGDDAAGRDDAHDAADDLDHALLVRLFGPIEVVDREGATAEFERSKTLELIAWLVTHRDRSTRSAARTALWELDVRDATFANVVSEARRALARLLPPPEGDEWVARTMTDSLPIHELVISDVDVVQHALDAALLQPPNQAIATLAPAVDLIGGLPFAGTAYLWPDAEGLTTNYILLATSATSELAAHCLSMGDVEGVFAATTRGLAVLPGHEGLIGLRMRAHAAAGDLAGVRQEWESYERVINGDPWSDGEPAPKLVELRTSLLSSPG